MADAQVVDEPYAGRTVPLWTDDHAVLPTRLPWEDVDGQGNFVLHYDQTNRDRLIAVHLNNVKAQGFPRPIATWHAGPVAGAASAWFAMATGDTRVPVICWPCLLENWG